MPRDGSQCHSWARRLAPLLASVLAIVMITALVTSDSPAQQSASQPSKGDVPPNSATAKQEADPAVAIVGSHIIRESDVRRAMGALRLGDQIDVRSRRARFIDSLVREELLFQSALRSAQSSRAMRDRLKSAIVGNIIQQDIRAKATVTEQQAREYYKATKSNLGGEHIHLRDIRFRDEATCRAQLKSIKTVDDFARVARTHHVLRDLGLDGGEVGTVMTRHVVFGYGEKLKGLAENKAHLILHDGNCHVVWISNREDHPVPTFAELRERLMAGLKAGAEADLVQELIAEARRQIAVTRFTKTEEEEATAENAGASRVGRDDPIERSNAASQQRSARSVKATETAAKPAPAPGTWQLTDHNGQAVTSRSLNGRPAILAFGFTYCPDVCPTTLIEMTNWIDLLGDNAKKLSWSFVSVDPERDSPDVLKSYLSNFSEAITGLTGAPEQLASLLTKYNVVARRVSTKDADYTMDHSSFVLLLDKAGNVVERIAYGTSADDAVRKIQKHVRSLENQVVKR